MPFPNSDGSYRPAPHRRPGCRGLSIGISDGEQTGWRIDIEEDGRRIRSDSEQFRGSRRISGDGSGQVASTTFYGGSSGSNDRIRKSGFPGWSATDVRARPDLQSHNARYQVNLKCMPLDINVAYFH
jgi:hypothetical protein